MCETETIRGLHVKDYHDLGVQSLEELIMLDEQLGDHLRKLFDYLQEEDYSRLKYNLDCLITDNDSHRDYCKQCQEDILANMKEIADNFEDYMNPPIDCPMSDEDEITICLKAHEIPNGDCVDCTEPCCPQSFYGTP